MNYRRELTIFGRCAVACLIAILLTSCSGFFPSKDTIVSMTISPGGAFVKPQGTQQYTATATFGNNSQGDVTDQVTWISSQSAIATIDASSGLATGVALGTSTITAKSSNNVTATTTLTVSNKTVTSLTINPQNSTLSLSGVLGGSTTVQFTATANFSDGTFATVTNQAGWSSSVPGVASISSTGFASAISVGSTTIGATYGGQSATTGLTVNQ